jgi:predicted unusual protein kinase regulating ubiquinone biosynthesis (AarF/ABC1/UbiB family)
MKWARQFTIVREAYRQYAAFKKFARLSPEQRVRSEIPSELPLALMRLGPTFIKLGQILSTRADMLPREYIQSLEILQEDVPPFPFEDVKTIFKEEFEKDVSEFYRSFDEVPAASASLAQVHFAVLPTGEQVAVKVQRPDVRKRIMDDLNALDSLLRFTTRIAPGLLKHSNLRAAFDEFSRYTLQELDFVMEANTVERFAVNFEEWEDVVIPKVHRTHTSSRILTMQRVSGMRLGEAVKVFPLEQRQKIVKRLMEMEMKMFISDGFFHADLHPGNILFREDGSLVLLDFGMFGELSDEEIDHFTLYWLAVVQRQVKRAFYHFTRMTSRLPQANENAFFEKFSSLAQRFYASKLSEMTITQVYFEMIAAGFRHGFVFPSHLMLHAKAITTAEALAFTLAPEIKAEQLTREAVRREFAKRVGDLRRLSFRIGQIVPELLLTGEVLPTSARDSYNPGFDAGFMTTGIFDILSSITEKVKRTNDPSALPRMLIDPFARTVLSEYHDEKGVQDILDEAWKRYEDIEPDIPILSQPGPTINLHLAGATLAMYEALRSAGHSHAEALPIFRGISWAIYDKMGDLPLMTASAITSDPHKRMKLATRMFRRFPFSSPGYQMVDVPSGENVVGFDVLKCPVAEFFISHGKQDLCYATWCALDFPLAEKWGGELERTTTIAEGASRCDFRWKTPSP